jgi:virulence factor Mce-like protein
MSRQGAASIAANPVLIGAATVLVMIVGVFLAYNANQGLPFVPVYQLDAEVPNAANLVEGNEVRMGGARIGQVTTISPVAREDGTYGARLQMQLETTVRPLPVDSTLIVRPRSALGLKYVEVTKGNSPEGFEDGQTIPLANAAPEPVEIDEVFNMFDEATRTANREVLVEAGGALAGRGRDLNAALAAFPELLDNLIPVMRNLRDERTGLARFFREVGRAAEIVAPIAETQAALFRNLDATFEALSEVSGSIQESIETAPPLLEEGIRSFPVQRPFLANTEALMRDLRPGVRALRANADDIADALERGTPTLRRLPELNRRLETTFTTLQEFANDPLASIGLRRLTQTMDELIVPLEYVTPAQTVCNYVTLWFRNIASLLSVGDRNGTWQRFIIVNAPEGPNNEGGPSSAPAQGPNEDNYLHANPYPNTASPGQPRECEAGNEPYLRGQLVTDNPPGNQGTETEETTIDRRR